MRNFSDAGPLAALVKKKGGGSGRIDLSDASGRTADEEEDEDD